MSLGLAALVRARLSPPPVTDGEWRRLGTGRDSVKAGRER
jgi:hypothetical protein